jgi:hypothetical protein
MLITRDGRDWREKRNSKFKSLELSSISLVPFFSQVSRYSR